MGSGSGAAGPRDSSRPATEFGRDALDGGRDLRSGSGRGLPIAADSAATAERLWKSRVGAGPGGSRFRDPEIELMLTTVKADKKV
jgi:hypothetical protein